MNSKANRPNASRRNWSAAVSVISLGLMSGAGASTQVIDVPVKDVITLTERVEERVPIERCRVKSVRVSRDDRDRSLTPTLLGGIIGGAVGSELGRNSSKKNLVIGASALLGGSIGHDIARDRYERIEYVNREVCDTDFEIREYSQITGYRVRYEYDGTTYETITDRHPGATLPLEISVRPLY
jgi:uncharacterized protein YcfJ